MDSELDSILLDIARKALIEEPKISCTFETANGDGYMGRIKMFDISQESEGREANKSKKLSLLAKLSPFDNKMHQYLPVAKAYEVEINIYTKIAPAFEKFQLEYNANCFNFIKCFYSNNTLGKETLIIENLSPKGFAMHDRQLPMKEAHIIPAFEQLAKLHALSFAMKALQPNIYKNLTELLKPNMFFHLYQNQRYDEFLKPVTEKFKTLFAGTAYYETFCAFSDRMYEELLKCNIEDEYSVICHGDAWCNNILYNCESGNPSEAIFVDYQLSQVSQPVTDLSYLFYGCADIALLPRLKEFLRFYHQTMATSLAMFGLDVEQIYPWCKLLQDWNKFGKFGLSTCFLIRVLMMSTPDEAPDLSNFAKDGSGALKAFNFKMKQEVEYNEAVQAVVRHFIDEKYIF